MKIREKLKTPEHLEDFKEVYIRYRKIQSIIRSCTTYEQIHSCERMVDNFRKWCIKSNVKYNTYDLLVRFLYDNIEFTGLKKLG